MSSTIGDAVASYVDSSPVTEGDYATEDDSRLALEAALTWAGCFNVYAEVDCWYFGGSVFGDKPSGRIDYVLTPKKHLIDIGWRMGCIGIEVKKSGHKTGPLVCQMIDYSKAIYRLPDACGNSLVCMTCVVAFPAFCAKGPLESIMANHRCGVVRIDRGGMSLTVGGTNILRHSASGLSVKNINCGYKNGSR